MKVRYQIYEKRRNFTKVVTDNLLLDHLDRKGFDHKDLNCRIKGCVKNVPEDFQHLIEDHIDRQMTSRDINKVLDKILKSEKSRKRKNSSQRPNYNLDAKTAQLVTEIFDNIGEPSIKIRKKQNPADDNQPKVKRKTSKRRPKKPPLIHNNLINYFILRYKFSYYPDLIIFVTPS